MGDRQVPPNLRAVLEAKYGVIDEAPYPATSPWSDIVSKLALRIEGAAQATGVTLSKKPLVIDLRTGRINAHALFHKKSGDYIIVLNDDVFTFALLASKVFTLAIPDSAWQGNKTSIKRLVEALSGLERFDLQAIWRFAELFISFSVSCRTSATPSYKLEDENRRGLAEVFINSIELFLVGHEYGHIVLGHLDSSQTHRSACAATESDELMYQHNQEFSVDALGLQFALTAMRLGDGDGPEWNTEWAFPGIAFFMTSMELLERASKVLETGNDPVVVGPSKSHPSFRARRQALEGLLIASGDPNGVHGALQLTSLMENTFRLLFESLLPTLKKLHVEGKRPSRLFFYPA